MKQPRNMTFLARSVRRFFALIFLLCLGGLLIQKQSASAAIFAPTEEELDAALERSPQSATDVRLLPHTTIDGKTYVQMGDMILLTKSHYGIESAFAGVPWTNGIVYYQFDAAVSAQNRQNWRDAAAEWRIAVPALSFVEGTGSGNYIYVQNSTVNTSFVGMIGGSQVMNILSWNSRFIIAHEIGHALGQIHEHQRTDRNSFVQINLANVQSGQGHNFGIWSPAAANYGTYDFDSVMHYNKCTFSIDCPPGNSCSCANYTITVPPPNQGWQDLMGQRDHLSQLDGSGMAQRYGGTPEATPPTVQTLAPSSVTSTSAVLNGTVTSNGGAPVDDYYFYYWIDPNSQIGIDASGITVSGNNFSAQIQGLTPGAAYHYRAYAHNSSTTNVGAGPGWGFGSVASFTDGLSGLGNISTRLRVETGDNVLIGGFIVTGTQAKSVILRAIGPSLPFTQALTDPVLELRNSSGGLIAWNDDWRFRPDGSSQQAEIVATGIPPTNILESALVATLPANNSSYTAIVRGYQNLTGIGVVEAYDLDRTVDSRLANISTRGFVDTGDNVMIAGTIIVGNNPARVLLRAIGPSLATVGVPNALSDPTIELRDGNGTLIASNDDWRFRPDGSSQEAEIVATGIPPTNILESALVATLPANNSAYTAVVRGYQNLTGVALVEAYQLE